MEDTSGTTANRLLARLDDDQRQQLMQAGTRVSFGPGEIVLRAGERLESVYFPEDLVVSFGSDLGGDGLIGAEGLVGWSAMTGCALSFDSTLAVLDGGSAIRLPAAAVKMACLGNPAFLRLLLRFAQTVAVQMSTTIASLRSDDVETRLARWLVMLHDRRAGDDLPMTHERLAEMLGVRRASVTDTLHRLEGDHHIRATRGHIGILDRAGLQAVAGKHYGGSEAVYDELMRLDPSVSQAHPAMSLTSGLTSGLTGGLATVA